MKDNQAREAESVPVIRQAAYIAAMPDGTLQRSYGKVFNQVADEYLSLIHI